jgi:hypothetical protein
MASLLDGLVARTLKYRPDNGEIRTEKEGNTGNAGVTKIEPERLQWRTLLHRVKIP